MVKEGIQAGVRAAGELVRSPHRRRVPVRRRRSPRHGRRRRQGTGIKKWNFLFDYLNTLFGMIRWPFYHLLSNPFWEVFFVSTAAVSQVKQRGNFCLGVLEMMLQIHRF